MSATQLCTFTPSFVPLSLGRIQLHILTLDMLPVCSPIHMMPLLLPAISVCSFCLIFQMGVFMRALYLKLPSKMRPFYFLLPSPTMRVVTVNSLQRLKPTNVTKGVYRVEPLRPRRSRRKLTAAEKTFARAGRLRRSSTLEDALSEAQVSVKNIALAMQQKVPGHQLDYYVRLILNAITNSKKSKRTKVSLWNAFLSIETKKRNQGAQCLAPILTQLVLTVLH